MREKAGEVMDLYWCDSPGAYYVRGHVPFDEAKATLVRYYGIPLEELGVEAAKHRWARYEPATGALKADGCDHAVRVYDAQKRGCFPVTEFPVEGGAGE